MQLGLLLELTYDQGELVEFCNNGKGAVLSIHSTSLASLGDTGDMPEEFSNLELSFSALAQQF